MNFIRRIFLLFITAGIFLNASSQPFALTCSPENFNGIAPAPWAIDGKVDDWRILLGQPTNNIFFPFGNMLGNNASYDTYGSDDPDNPSQQSDIRVISTIHDDYNIYFYLRRLHKGNIPNKAFYFLDTDLDGIMEPGEPVICINFNAQTVNKLSICRYVPSVKGIDSLANNCVGIDGYSMAGTMIEDISSATAVLQPHEIFDAAVTEGGYGLELAVPWRLISQYKFFIYHTALQRGTGMYDPSEPSDNAAGCKGFIDIIGSPYMEVQSTSVTTLIQGLSYRFQVNYKSLVPTDMLVSGSDFIKIKNIVSNNNLPVNENDFSIFVNDFPLSYNRGTFAQQPIIYSAIGAGINILPAFGISTLTIDVHLPADLSVKSAEIEFTPVSLFIYILDCINLIGGGGKPINPVGFSIETELVPFKINTGSPGIMETEVERKIQIYPNPSKGSATVILPETTEPVNMVISDYLGRVIRKWDGIRQQSILIEKLHPGFYTITVRSKDGNLLSADKMIVTGK